MAESGKHQLCVRRFMHGLICPSSDSSEAKIRNLVPTSQMGSEGTCQKVHGWYAARRGFLGTSWGMVCVTLLGSSWL